MLPQHKIIIQIMLLTEVQNYIKCKKIFRINNQDVNFKHISKNSKNIKKLSIFAIRNSNKLKINYIQEAASKGAIAILTNKLIKNLKISQIIVDNIDLSIELLLKKLYPDKPLNIVAVTGTNGKTSVAWYISQICLYNKIQSKTYGTLGYYINNKKYNNSFLTTPDYEILYQAAFLKKNNKYNFIFEASSHALDQDRLKNFPVNIAAITNITQDHLDYHKNFKSYQKSKFNLFLKYLNKKGYAILNDEIPNINFLKKEIDDRIKIISYGNIKSDIYLINNKNNLKIKFFEKNYIIKSIKLNEIELENLSCTIACSYCLGIQINNILYVIKKISNPPGRLEKVINNKNLKIFIDYAHTPDALKQVLLSKTKNNIKPNLIFGCGGNRDQYKRFKMGYIADKFANKVYITDDNPRLEDPSLIRKQILSKCKKGYEISNRKNAIFSAIKDLKKNEILIIAGKGHEKNQINKFSIKKFDDVAIARLAIKNK